MYQDFSLLNPEQYKLMDAMEDLVQNLINYSNQDQYYLKVKEMKSERWLFVSLTSPIIHKLMSCTRIWLIRSGKSMKEPGRRRIVIINNAHSQMHALDDT